ncbi:ABC transporter substrate-binding protein [Terrilactibacillus laevilacticus]|uniref:ABC transporter substrate-binding protein n=1 Tax=Terrilactibacillus laevilacticus TaxID=1380157 RepID=A0ABW5PLV4_9BACI|nr:ABC transporter substrate-binding protein [Terrilactibacillus laevilacticus]
MNKKLLMSLLLLVCLSLTACGGNHGTSSSKGGDQLVIAADQDPVGLDPQTVPAASSSRIYSLIYNSLTKINSNFEIEPSLASSWKVSDGGKTITFNLQKGIKFQNGKEFTSDDVKYTFNRILDPKVGAIAKSYFTSIKDIQTPDKNTVVFHLNNPDSAFITNTSSVYTSIISKDVKNLNKEAVGTGPYKLSKIVNGQYVLLKENTDYKLEDKPKIKSIKFNIMKDDEQRLAAIRAGKVDIATLNSDSASLLSKSKNIKIKKYQSMEYSYLGINNDKKPFNNIKVRQALSYVIDRNEIIDTVWKGKAELTGPISPAQKEFAADVKSFPSYTQNLSKAKELLKEAGYPNGFSTVIQTASTYPDMVDTAQVLQQQLKKIGINAKIEQLEWGKYIEVWKSKKMDLMIGRNTSGSDPDRSLRFFFATDGSANVWNYSDNKFDKLVQSALQTTDSNARKNFYQEAQELLVNQDAANLFLASPINYYAVNDRVSHFTPSAAGEAYALLNATLK